MMILKCFLILLDSVFERHSFNYLKKLLFLYSIIDVKLNKLLFVNDLLWYVVLVVYHLGLYVFSNFSTKLTAGVEFTKFLKTY